MKLCKTELPTRLHLYCVDAPDGAHFVDRSLTACLRFIARRAGTVTSQLTVGEARRLGYSMRIV